MFTFLYSIRLWYFTFYYINLAQYKYILYKYERIGKIEKISLIVLINLSITGGFYFKDIFIGLGNLFFLNNISKTSFYLNAEFLPI
jgi:hypothetical protein